MIEYLKIETPFNRDNDGTKKMIDGDFRNEAVEFLKDCHWIGTEKIDGTNIGVVWDGHHVSFQGRTERAEIPKMLNERLEELFGGSVNEELFEQKFGDTKMILFGEGYGVKIQKGGSYIPDGNDFILFDVYCVDTNTWLTRESVEDIARTFNINVVPIVVEGTLNELIDFVKTKPKSTIGTANMEGIVARPIVELKDRMGKRVITKIKVKDFC